MAARSKVHGNAGLTVAARPSHAQETEGQHCARGQHTQPRTPVPSLRFPSPHEGRKGKGTYFLAIGISAPCFSLFLSTPQPFSSASEPIDEIRFNIGYFAVICHGFRGGHVGFLASSLLMTSYSSITTKAWKFTLEVAMEQPRRHYLLSVKVAYPHGESSHCGGADKLSNAVSALRVILLLYPFGA